MRIVRYTVFFIKITKCKLPQGSRLPSFINITLIVFRAGTWSNCRHSQNKGVSAHSLERSSREQTNFSKIFSCCDRIGDDGYLKDMPLICGILIAPLFKPEIFLDT